jgi:hypothetical protein
MTAPRSRERAIVVLVLLLAASAFWLTRWLASPHADSDGAPAVRPSEGDAVEPLAELSAPEDVLRTATERASQLESDAARDEASMPASDGSGPSIERRFACLLRFVGPSGLPVARDDATPIVKEFRVGAERVRLTLP